MPLKSLKCHSSRRQKFAAKCHSCPPRTPRCSSDACAAIRSCRVSESESSRLFRARVRARVAWCAMAAAADVGAGSVLQAPRVGARWLSKQAGMAAIAAHADAYGFAVKVHKSDRKRLMVKCSAEGCTFRARLIRATKKDGPGAGGPWVLRAFSPQHTCDGTTQRTRNYRRGVVIRSAGSLSRSFVPPAGTGGGGVQQLRDMVARHDALDLRASQARRHLADGLCASAKDFVGELQVLRDYLRQLQEQDPAGGYGDA